jgi:hypothetical protein
MDSVIADVFTRMATTHRCSTEDILEQPELRQEFLADTRSLLGNLPERDLLHRLSVLRKQRKLPRSRDLASRGVATSVPRIIAA